MVFFGRTPKQPERKPLEKARKELLDAMILAMKGDEFDDDILRHVNSAMKEGLSLDDEVIAHQLLGRVYFNQKRHKEAEAQIKSALELNERRLKKLDVMLYYSAWETLAMIYLETSHPDKAIGCYQEVVEQLRIRYGGEEGGVEAIVAKAYCQLAKIHLAVFEDEWGIERIRYYLQNAIEYSHKAIKADAKFPDPYEILGDIHGYEIWGRFHNPFYSPIEAAKFYKMYLASELIGEEDGERVQKRLKNMM